MGKCVSGSAHLLLYGAAANAFFNYVSTSMHKADSRSTKVGLSEFMRS